MTQCVIAGKGACQCQPQEGMECPHGTPSLVQAALNAESSLLRAHIRVLREALEKIEPIAPLYVAEIVRVALWKTK